MSFKYKGKEFNYSDEEMESLFDTVGEACAGIERGFNDLPVLMQEDIRDRAGKLDELKFTGKALLITSFGWLHNKLTGSTEKESEVIVGCLEIIDKRTQWFERGHIPLYEQANWFDFYENDREEVTKQADILENLGFQKTAELFRIRLAKEAPEPEYPGELKTATKAQNKTL